MAISQVLAIFITYLLWLLLSSSLSQASETDINCLKSIKSELNDPNGFLSNWVFGNSTAGYICDFTGVSCWNSDENRVLGIKLPGFGLTGEFPRGIKDCTSLQTLDLSRNNLSGTLPSDIFMSIVYVIYLDLSFNSFSGEIPASLTNCLYLNTLILNNNRFTGHLPPQLAWLRRLREFSVANNRLSGPVPNFTDPAIDAGSYTNNPGLCGGPLGPCPASTIPMILTGALVGAVVFAPVGVATGWFCFGREEKHRKRRS